MKNQKIATFLAVATLVVLLATSVSFGAYNDPAAGAGPTGNAPVGGGPNQLDDGDSVAQVYIHPANDTASGSQPDELPKSAQPTPSPKDEIRPSKAPQPTPPTAERAEDEPETQPANDSSWRFYGVTLGDPAEVDKSLAIGQKVSVAMDAIYYASADLAGSGRHAEAYSHGIATYYLGGYATLDEFDRLDDVLALRRKSAVNAKERAMIFFNSEDENLWLLLHSETGEIGWIKAQYITDEHYLSAMEKPDPTPQAYQDSKDRDVEPNSQADNDTDESLSSSNNANP